MLPMAIHRRLPLVPELDLEQEGQPSPPRVIATPSPGHCWLSLLPPVHGDLALHCAHDVAAGRSDQPLDE